MMRFIDFNACHSRFLVPGTTDPFDRHTTMKSEGSWRRNLKSCGEPFREMNGDDLCWPFRREHVRHYKWHSSDILRTYLSRNGMVS